MEEVLDFNSVLQQELGEHDPLTVQNIYLFRLISSFWMIYSLELNI
jgi:hypothetical protein